MLFGHPRRNGQNDGTGLSQADLPGRSSRRTFDLGNLKAAKTPAPLRRSREVANARCWH